MRPANKPLYTWIYIDLHIHTLHTAAIASFACKT
jgi:hypothetical protein